MNDYAMYLRKSRADIEAEALGEMETLSRHRKILTALAKRNGHKISETYQEIVSGESIQDRPEMQRLLKDLYQKQFKGVYVMEVERLARGDTRDQGTVAEAFKYSNTLIITPVKTYNPNNQYDEEYFEFGLFMSRREYKTIQRRLQTGKIQAIKEGNYMGSLPPYGYDILKIGRNNRTLEPNDQAQYVKMMFDWFVNDKLSCGAIARKMTTMGVLTLTGKREWNRATIKDILQNNLYTGKIRWYRRKRSKEFNEDEVKQTKRRLTPDDYLIADGKHPALIDQEVFDKAQTLFAGVVPVKANETIVSPFARLMFCKHCGKRISYSSYAYRKNVPPRMVHGDSIHCKVKSAPFENVMDAVVQSLKLHVADFEFKLTNDGAIEESKRHQTVIDSMTSELKILESQRSGLFDKLERGIYTDDEFIERKQVLTVRINKLQQSIAEEKSNAPEEVDYEEKIVQFNEVLDALSDDSVEARTKNNLLKSIISKIEYDCEDLGRNKGGIVKLDIHLK